MTFRFYTAFRTALLAAALLVLSGIRMPVLAQQRRDLNPGNAAISQASGAPEAVDENFVIASLLISEPGGALYSRLGHAALRMQCPEHNLDYVFTYEPESIKERPLGFLAGKLKTKMAAVPSGLYFDCYSKENRGLVEYTLNLPIETKRNLWRVLDQHLVNDTDVPYNHLKYGCAHIALIMLEEGLGNTEVNYGSWPVHFDGASRREITCHHIKDDKWTAFLLHFIVNGEIDDLNCDNKEKVIIPEDLPAVLQNASINGVRLIDSEPRRIVPSGEPFKTGWFSPMLLACLLLVLTIVCTLLKTLVMDYVLLTIQTLLGIAAVFLLFSSLVCTEWSWLIIPFNPLPLIFWKWHRHWALPYAIVLLIWCAFMSFWPHVLTDSAYIVLAFCLCISYFGISQRSRSYEKE